MFYAQLGIFVYDKTPDTKAPTGLEVFHRTVGHTEYKQKCPHNLSEVVGTKKNNALADKKLITYKPIQIFGQFSFSK